MTWPAAAISHENAPLKRLKFAAQSERFNAEQRSRLDETLDEDVQAVSDGMAQLSTEPIPVRVKDQPKRRPLPAHLPRIANRHVHGKWACAECGTQVLVAKSADHLPLCRQEAIFGRARLAIPRSTLNVR